MKTTYWNFNNWVISTLIILNACAQQVQKAGDKVETTRESVVETSYTRVCPTSQTLNNTNGSKLSEFFGTVINPDYIEGSVNYCLFVDRLGSKVESGFAIELEHGSSTITTNDNNDGILFLEFGQSAAKRIKSSVVLNSETDTVTINLIYRDNFGLVQVKGSGSSNSPINAEVRFYNFLPYAEAVTAAAQRAKEECLAAIAARDGTAAQKCWGLQPALTRAWWLQDTVVAPTAEQVLIDAAEEALISSGSRKLGEIQINLSDIM